MNTFSNDLAVFGAEPALPRRLPLGQQNFPDWQRYEAAFRDIFKRQYYTNHGPLAQALEARLAEHLHVGHAICVTTATIGLALAAQALGVKGKVVVPALSYVQTAQSLAWAGVKPEFCDVCPETGHLTPRSVEAHLHDGVTGILAANLWGGAADIEGLRQLAERRGIALYFDSAHAFSCEIGGQPVGGFGRLEVISFHSSHILGAAEGAVICTNDDDLAAHVRNIRSNYGMGRRVPVGKTANGRLSEAQAAIGLMNLDDLPELLARNRRLYETYRECLADIPGLQLVAPAGVSASNHQNVVCRIDAERFGLSRDALISVLDAENVEALGDRGLGAYMRSASRPAAALRNTEDWLASVLHLPIGAQVDVSAIERIAARIRFAGRHAADVARKLGA
jgi:dTDP-4-amino-4,6-dideoxygalactose transaminase